MLYLLLLLLRIREHRHPTGLSPMPGWFPTVAQCFHLLLDEDALWDMPVKELQQLIKTHHKYAAASLRASALPTTKQDLLPAVRLTLSWALLFHLLPVLLLVLASLVGFCLLSARRAAAKAAAKAAAEAAAAKRAAAAARAKERQRRQSASGCDGGWGGAESGADMPRSVAVFRVDMQSPRVCARVWVVNSCGGDGSSYDTY